MQKIKFFFLAIALSVICTSCANVQYEMEINKDGSANLSYLIEINQEEFENYKERYDTTISSIKKALEETGFSVNEYSDKENIKFEAKIYLDDVNKIDEFNTLLEPLYDDRPTILHEKNIFGEKYEINGKIDLTGYSETEKDLEKDKLISDNLPIKFNLKTPVKVKESNADESDGSQLSWKLRYNQENIISAECKSINYTVIIGLCGIVFIVAQIITIKMVKKILKNK